MTRRKFLQTTTAASLAAIPALAEAQAAPAARPNVLLIFFDDLGTLDLNCYGSKDLVTPNLDALAASGTRFTQFYSACPVCSASRAGTLTGKYPQRAGLATNASSQPGGGTALPHDVPTVASILKSADYATGHVGKWHMGYTPQTMPNAHGFDFSFGHMGGCIDNFSHFFFWSGPNRHDLHRNGVEEHHEGEYFGDLMVKEAKDFISNHKAQPFFLYFAINQPHYPLQGKPHWREKYKHLPSPRNMYAASVSTADEMVGQILQHLESLGLRENTLIIFQSDHGHSTEDRAFFGGGNTGPYRGAKFSCFEGGIRVPSIISCPALLPKAQVRDQLVTGVDYLPTILELTHTPLPPGKFDGHSLLPILQSANTATLHPVYHWQLDKQWAVRDGDWKLIGNPNDTSKKAPITPNDKLFLVNLGEDVSEMKNLAGAHPQIVQRLEGLHREWLADVSAR